jgi:hypothetical protein
MAPFKELRFTRSQQAVTFVIAGVVCVSIAGGLLVLYFSKVNGPNSPWWALLPLTAAWASFRLAAHLTRHAFLLLSPIGIEIFPFFRPAQNMTLFSWGEIQHAEVSPDTRLLTLTLAGYTDSKVIISLDPVKPGSRPLLAKAIAGVMEKRAGKPEDAPADSASDEEEDTAEFER